MNFSDALNLAVSGKRIAREGWNGKGLWVSYISDNSWYFKGFAPLLVQTMQKRAWLGLKDINDTFGPWIPSTSDLLANDWVEVKDEHKEVFTKEKESLCT